MIFTGFDISKEKVDLCCLLDSSNMKVKTKVFRNNLQFFQDIANWLLKTTQSVPANITITMEPTGVYHEPLSHFLYKQGFTILLVNPGKAKKFAESMNLVHKTDKSDAIMLARYGESKHANSMYWQPVNPEVRELQALIRRLDALESNRQREVNRLEASEFSEGSEYVTQSIKNTIHFFDDQIKAAKSYIDALIAQYPELKRNRALLESIPGIGPVLSRELTSLFAAKQFKTAKQVAAYCGLIPKLKESGAMKGRTTLSKLGPSRIRCKLYMAAVVAGQHNALIKKQKGNLKQSGKTSMQILGANMRKLVQICFGVVKTQTEFKHQES